MIRARTLFPLRNGSVTVAAKPTADARAVLSSRSISRTARGPLHAFDGHHDRFGLALGIRRDVVLRVQRVVFHPTPSLAWSLPQRVAPEPQSMTGQTPDKSPDAHRMPLARGDNASDAASCVTFDGLTRLRTERAAVAH